ncbi:NADH-quinone oxidoreductase subunit N [Nostoc sp. CHAB 5824]|nr:NADH-quinone oxidoreductase subunit N [Nostoc sp. CHAB 5824]
MYPIVILSITGLITLFLGFLKSRKILLPATILFLLIAVAAGFLDWNKPGLYFNAMIDINNTSIIFGAIILITAILILPLSAGRFDDETAHPAEYYAIMQMSLVGAIIMVSFQNLIMLFVGIEILSVALYVLTGSDKRNLRGNEAALKYFLMGSFATGILLFGIAMYYGATGSFNISASMALIKSSHEGKIFFWIGIFFMLIGLLFKVSAAPFHFWTADVYEGAPTFFTTFMATVVKTAGFYAIFKLISVSFSSEFAVWSNLIIGAIVLSLSIGNISAVYQSSFKRLLAFSSISQAGYMLLSVIGMSNQSEESLAFYSVSYSLASISAFGVLMVVSKNTLENGRPNESISVFNGLLKKSPFLAVILSISLFSLSGIPLTAGFWGKFFVFSDAAYRNLTWLLVFAVIMSAVGIYYYFKPIIAALFKDTENSNTIELYPAVKVCLFLTTLGTIIFGLFPNLVRSFF